MKFHILCPDQYELWDYFVDSSPQGSLFSKTSYMDAVGYPYKIGVVLKKDNIQGGIVLAKNEIRSYSNPMFAKYLGILCRPMEGKYVRRISSEKKIIEAIVSHIGWCKSFDYSFHPAFINWLPFYWKGYRQETRYTYRFDNLEDIESIYDGMDAVVRNEIRKAEKNGIQVEANVPIDLFFRINSLTYERQGGGIPYSFDCLKKFYDKLKENDAIRLMGAFDAEKKCHAVCGIVYDRRCCYFILNGIDHTLPSIGANTLLTFSAIETAAKRSFSFDFEGSMIPSIEHFYRGFGGKLTAYFNIWKGNIGNSIRRKGIRLFKKIRYGR